MEIKKSILHALALLEQAGASNSTVADLLSEAIDVMPDNMGINSARRAGLLTSKPPEPDTNYHSVYERQLSITEDLTDEQLIALSRKPDPPRLAGRGAPKLSNKQRERIIERVKAGEMQRKVAMEYRITQARVSQIMKKAAAVPA